MNGIDSNSNDQLQQLLAAEASRYASECLRRAFSVSSTSLAKKVLPTVYPNDLPIGVKHRVSLFIKAVSFACSDTHLIGMNLIFREQTAQVKGIISEFQHLKPDFVDQMTTKYCNKYFRAGVDEVYLRESVQSFLDYEMEKEAFLLRRVSTQRVFVPYFHVNNSPMVSQTDSEPLNQTEDLFEQTKKLCEDGLSFQEVHAKLSESFSFKTIETNAAIVRDLYVDALLSIKYGQLFKEEKIPPLEPYRKKFLEEHQNIDQMSFDEMTQCIEQFLRKEKEYEEIQQSFFDDELEGTDCRTVSYAGYEFYDPKTLQSHTNTFHDEYAHVFNWLAEHADSKFSDLPPMTEDFERLTFSKILRDNLCDIYISVVIFCKYQALNPRDLDTQHLLQNNPISSESFNEETFDAVIDDFIKEEIEKERQHLLSIFQTQIALDAALSTKYSVLRFHSQEDTVAMAEQFQSEHQTICDYVEKNAHTSSLDTICKALQSMVSLITGSRLKLIVISLINKERVSDHVSKKYSEYTQVDIFVTGIAYLLEGEQLDAHVTSVIINEEITQFIENQCSALFSETDSCVDEFEKAYDPNSQQLHTALSKFCEILEMRSKIREIHEQSNPDNYLANLEGFRKSLSTSQYRPTSDAVMVLKHEINLAIMRRFSVLANPEDRSKPLQKRSKLGQRAEEVHKVQLEVERFLYPYIHGQKTREESENRTPLERVINPLLEQSNSRSTVLSQEEVLRLAYQAYIHIALIGFISYMMKAKQDKLIEQTFKDQKNLPFIYLLAIEAMSIKDPKKSELNEQVRTMYENRTMTYDQVRSILSEDMIELLEQVNTSRVVNELVLALPIDLPSAFKDENAIRDDVENAFKAIIDSRSYYLVQHSNFQWKPGECQYSRPNPHEALESYNDAPGVDQPPLPIYKRYDPVFLTQLTTDITFLQNYLDNRPMPQDLLYYLLSKNIIEEMESPGMQLSTFVPVTPLPTVSPVLLDQVIDDPELLRKHLDNYALIEKYLDYFNAHPNALPDDLLDFLVDEDIIYILNDKYVLIR